jgi:hypothetical protein
VPGDIEADFHKINAAASGTERHRVGNTMPFAWCPTTTEAILDQAKPGAETEWLLPVTPGYRLPRWPRVSAPRETSLWIELHGGGYAAEMALTVRGIGRAELLVITHGAEVAHSAGMFSGLPGVTVTQPFNGKRLGPKPTMIPMPPGR